MTLIPKTNYTDYYDIAKFNLTWNISFFLSIILSGLGLAFLFLDNGATIPTLLGALVSLLMLFILYKTKSFKVASYFFVIFGVFTAQFTLLYYDDLVHFVDVLWILMVVLYAYFTLEKKIGNLVLIINIIGVSYYILFIMDQNIKNIEGLHRIDAISLTINYIVVSIIISYFLFQFINTTKYAENKYKSLTIDLQNKNEQVERQNEEKTVMLREIHHRVKNNLQVITSLLRLQSNEINDKYTQEIYSNTINRVVAMSLIHDKIYQNKDLAKINLEDYLHSLVDEISLSYETDKKVEVKIYSDAEYINPKNLVPIALIFNELISNSLKYAFQSVEKGSISININVVNKIVKIVYADNGIWLEKQKENSFGLELIDSLVEQMEGNLERTVGNGTVYIFEFPELIQ